MTNNIKAFDFNGVKVKIDSNTKLIRLISPSSAVNISYHDTSTGANYQVPSGKKLTLIFIENFDANTTTQIASTTAVDSATGAIVLFDPGNAAISNLIFISTEVAQNLFITNIVSGVSDTPVIFGIEETA